MGKDWDAFVPGPEIWREVFRVLKPGGHCLVFAGTRTQDWMSLALRFAGFDVYDVMQWLYGSGFPKSLDIGKAIDRHLGFEREKVRFDASEIRNPKSVQSGHGVDGGDRPWMQAALERGYHEKEGNEPASEAGAVWDGWGSQLKPAYEPIIVAQKPLEGTYAENTLKWGCGGLNIDGSRIGMMTPDEVARSGQSTSSMFHSGDLNWKESGRAPKGRWPANVILQHDPRCVFKGKKTVNEGKKGTDYNMEESSARSVLDDGSRDGVCVNRNIKSGVHYGEEEVEDYDCHPDCPCRILDEQSGETASAVDRNLSEEDTGSWFAGQRHTRQSRGDTGGASRFFYCAKADRKERWAFCRKCNVVFQRRETDEHGAHREDVTMHPTQKPEDLMRYLVRLVTPPGGVVLDPFCGTGTTAVAAKLEGFHFITCDLSADYAKIAEARLARVHADTPDAPAGAYFCPRCRENGEITLIAKHLVEDMREEGKKIACRKCLKRFSPDEFLKG